MEVKRGRPKKEDDMEQVEEVAEKKTGTKPGFKPATRLGNLKAKPGFTARWVRNDSANIARKRAEGWIIMQPKDNIGTYEEITDVTEARPVHNGIRYQDMIAMMLPDDLKQSRQEYYRNEVKESTRSIFRQTDNDFKQAGVQIYTPKGQGGRIVID